MILFGDVPSLQSSPTSERLVSLWLLGGNSFGTLTSDRLTSLWFSTENYFGTFTLEYTLFRTFNINCGFQLVKRSFAQL